MVTLVTEQKFKFGQTNILPFVGKVKISATGEIEVANEDLAAKVVAARCGFNYPHIAGNLEATTTTTVAPTTTTTTLPEETTTTTTIEVVDQTTTTTTIEELNTQVDQDDLNQGQQDDLGQQQQDDLSKNTTEQKGDLDKTEARTALEAKTLSALKELAKPFPSKDWRNLDKAALIEFLLVKTFE